MKKIGILTYYYKSKNIGGLLQSYALPSILNKNGFKAEQICFDYNFFDKKAKEIHLKLFLRKYPIYKLPFVIIKRFCLTFPRRIFSIWKNKKINKFVQIQNKIAEEFENFIPHSEREYNTSNIQNVNSVYDIFISGSDQVFARYLLPLSAYYGEFAEPDKAVISYAASSDAQKFTPQAEVLFAKKLQRLNKIGVREKTLKDYIENITGQKAYLVLDPTFLLSKEDWLKIANPKIVLSKKYIFCYFLGEKAVWQRRVAQNYADKYGYEVIHLPYIMRTVRFADKCLKGQGRYDVGPREFISLINGAECVFTDSFHGLAFSVNFGKNFYVFNRDDKAGENSMNARITDTLEMLSLTERHITNKNAVLDNVPIDFIQVHKILKEEKQKSITWLLNSLKVRK